MEKEQSDNEEAEAPKRALRVRKLAAICIGNPVLDQVFKKPANKTDVSKDTKGVPKSKDKSKLHSKEPAKSDEQAKKRPVGRPKKLTVEETKKLEQINRETAAAIAKQKKKEEAEIKKAAAKAAALEKKQQEQKIALEAKKAKLGIQQKTAVKGKSVTKSIQKAWRHDQHISSQPDDNNGHSKSNSPDSGSKNVPKPSPRSKKPIGSYQSEEENEEGKHNIDLKKARRSLSFDTPKKNDSSRTRKQPTPKKITGTVEESSSDEDLIVPPKADPSFDALSTALKSSQSAPTTSENTDQSVFQAASLEGKVQEGLTHFKSQKNYDPAMEAEVEEALRNFYNDNEQTQQSAEPSDTQQSEADATKRKGTKDVLSHLLSQMFGSTNASMLMDFISSGKGDKKKVGVPQKKVLIEKDPQNVPDLDVNNDPANHSVQGASIAPLKNANLGIAPKEPKDPGQGPTSATLNNPKLSQQITSDISLEAKVQEGLTHFKNQKNYDPAMEAEMEEALRNFYNDNEQTQQSAEPSDTQQSGADETKRKGTKDVLLHLLSQMFGSTNASMLMDFISSEKGDNRKVGVPQKKVLIQKDPTNKPDLGVNKDPCQTQPETSDPIQSLFQGNEGDLRTENRKKTDAMMTRIRRFELCAKKSIVYINKGSKENAESTIFHPISEAKNYMENACDTLTSPESHHQFEKMLASVDVELTKLENVMDTEFRNRVVPSERMVEMLSSNINKLIPTKEIQQQKLDEVLADYEKTASESPFQNTTFTSDFLDYYDYCERKNLTLGEKGTYKRFSKDRLFTVQRNDSEAKETVKSIISKFIDPKTKLDQFKLEAVQGLIALLDFYEQFENNCSVTKGSPQKQPPKIIYLSQTDDPTSVTGTDQSIAPPTTPLQDRPDSPFFDLSEDENITIPNTGELMKTLGEIDLNVFPDIAVDQLDFAQTQVPPSTNQQQVIAVDDALTANIGPGTNPPVDSNEPTEAEENEHVKASRKARAAKARGTKRTMVDIVADTAKKIVPKKKPKTKPKILHTTEPKRLSDIALSYIKSVKNAMSTLPKSPPSPAQSVPTDADLSSDSGSDKDFIPSKKDLKNSDIDFSDDDKSGKVVKKPRKKSKKETKAASSLKAKEDESSKGVPEADTDPSTGKKRKQREQIFYATNFASEGKKLLEPIEQRSGVMLEWDQVQKIIDDKDLVHGDINSYFEPSDNCLYVIRNFICTPENIKEIAHRDNFFCRQAGMQPRGENKDRYKYKTKLKGVKEFSLDVRKYIYAKKDENTLIVQYMGNVDRCVTKAQEPASPADVDINESASKKARLSTETHVDYRKHKGTVSHVEDVDDISAEEYQKRLEENEVRRREKRRNALSNYIRTLRSTPVVLPESQSVNVKMNERSEADEALILDDPEEDLSNREIQSVIDEAIRLGEGIEDGHTKFISVPEGGKLYLFNCSKMNRPWNEVLLNDSYRYVHKGHNYLAKYNFDKTKWYGRDGEGRPTSDFKKYTYYNTDTKMLAIHYRGNVDLLGRPSHGNCRKATHVHVPTSASLMDDVKNLPYGTTATKGHQILTEKLPGGVANTIVGTRGRKAVQYLMTKQQAENWIKRADELKAVSVACDYTSPFCRTSQNAPYYAALFATDKSLDELKKIISNMPDNAQLLLHYDTTYEYGNYFISILSYRHPFLQRTDSKPGYLSDKPIVPIFYCMHEKKFQDIHKWLFNRMEHIFDQRYPNIRRSFKSVQKTLVTDKEFNGHELLHNCNTVHCWQHLRKNIDFTAHKKHLSAGEVTAVVKDFEAMLTSRTEQSYKKRRDVLMEQPHWRNTGMKEYFLKEMDNDLLQFSGRWVLQALNIGHDQKGITNNPAETVNSSVSRLTNKKLNKNKSPAEGILALLHYAKHSDHAVESAYYGGTDTIQVHKDYHFMKKKLGQAPPVDIEGMNEMISNITKAIETPHDTQVSETPPKRKYTSSDDAEVYNQLGQMHVDEGRVYDVPDRQLFFGVRDIVTDDVCWVDYMQDSCTCPHGNVMICPHKVAVKLRYGLHDPDEKRKGPAKSVPLAFNPTMAKTPIYGTKKPTKDDNYNVALHGVKKAPKKVVAKRDKEIKEAYLAAIGIDPSRAAALATQPDIDPAAAMSLDIEEVVLNTNDQQLSMDEISVRTNECKIFTHDGQDKFAILRPTNNRVLIFHKPKEERRLTEQHMMNQFAMSARKDATYEENTRNKPLVLLCLKEVQPTKDLRTELVKYHQRPSDEQLNIFRPDVKIELGCYCRMPMTGGRDATSTVTCNACKANYHTACLTKSERDRCSDRKQWQCGCCGIPRNVEWGHNNNMYNTCTIDNQLETVYLGLRNNTNLLANFPSDEAHQCLSACITKVAENKCSEAQEMWYNHIMQADPSLVTYPEQSKNMWGNADDVSFHTLRSAQRFVRWGRCQYVDCDQRDRLEDSNWFVIHANCGSFAEQINRHVAERQSPCTKCGVGVVDWKKLAMEKKDNTWLIRFSGSGAHTPGDSTPTDYYNLPPTLKIEDEAGTEHDFKLQSATIQVDSNHFVSLQSHNGKLVFFDGMGERHNRPFPRRFRAPLPSDTDPFGPRKAILNSIVYIRQF